MTKLFSALLAGVVTLASSPAATAQAWVHVREQVVDRYTGPDPVSYNDVTIFDPSQGPVPTGFGVMLQMRNGQPSLIWGARAEVFDDIHGWHPRLREQDMPDVIRDRAPWRGYLPAMPASGTSDRVYEDLMLSLSIRRTAWGAEHAPLGAFDDDGLQAPRNSSAIPDGWVVTGRCLGRGTVWYGDMGISQCVDGYAMRALIEPPRRPPHP